jgi:hypothetical protein
MRVIGDRGIQIAALLTRTTDLLETGTAVTPFGVHLQIAAIVREARPGERRIPEHAQHLGGVFALRIREALDGRRAIRRGDDDEAIRRLDRRCRRRFDLCAELAVRRADQVDRLLRLLLSKQRGDIGLWRGLDRGSGLLTTGRFRRLGLRCGCGLGAASTATAERRRRDERATRPPGARWLPDSHGVSEAEVVEASPRARRLLRLEPDRARVR